LNEGFCEPKECPTPKKCDKCDLSYTRKDDCNCAEAVCTPTYEEEKHCPPPKIAKVTVAAPCEQKQVICQPPICKKTSCTTKKADCTQCEDTVIVITAVPNENGTICYCEEEKCRPREKCLTKKEAQKILKCEERCQEPILTEEELACGCRKWVCGPKEDKCPESCGECKECKKVFDPVCERPMHKCQPKKCEGKKACEVEDVVNGEPKIDKCGCPLFKDKPCDNDPVHVCKKDEYTVVAGEDACGCATSIKKPCPQQKPPPCNGTCHELIETSDGCCRKWTCQKKPCPEVPKITCPDCHTITVHDDECKCCTSTCERTPCPKMKRCPIGEKPVTVEGPCGCLIILRCDPEGGHVTTCPKDKKCKGPETTKKLCTECED